MDSFIFRTGLKWLLEELEDDRSGRGCSSHPLLLVCRCRFCFYIVSAMCHSGSRVFTGVRSPIASQSPKLWSKYRLLMENRIPVVRCCHKYQLAYAVLFCYLPGEGARVGAVVGWLTSSSPWRIIPLLPKEYIDYFLAFLCIDDSWTLWKPASSP